jgi:hypothetical protein|tara:strand:+ start:165 stop:533 length:369 start_codon:yes stop_codon:yes gene_type:complete
MNKNKIIEMKTRLKSVKQMNKVNDLTTIASSFITSMFVEGLTEDQKQDLRNFFSESRGELTNQPDWSDNDYLLQTIQTLYEIGFEEGALKESDRLTNLLKKHEELIAKLTKDVSELLENGTK